jgi:uncharacterized protein YdeI (YjbR/CyaY-like superfamily)
MQPLFFATPDKFRTWLAAHHATEKELLVGFYKKGSGKPSITWPESVNEALCFGWIDGVRRSLGADAYVIRFTPRKPTSVWSAVNVRRVSELKKLGKMQAAGLAAFAARRADKTGIYSFERTEAAALSDAQQKLLRRNRKASAFFDAQAPWYRRAALHWVVSAKREETQARRLAELITCSASGKTIPLLTRPTGSSRAAKKSPAPRKASRLAGR